jgi:hypothetical protein
MISFYRSNPLKLLERIIVPAACWFGRALHCQHQLAIQTQRTTNTFESEFSVYTPRLSGRMRAHTHG